MAKKISKEFGERMTRLTKEPPFAGMTRKDIAAKLGINAPLLTYYCQGKKMPAMEHACELAIKLDVCVDWLLTGRGNKRPGEAHPDDNGNTVTFDMTGIPSEQRGYFTQALHAVAQSVREMIASYK